MMVRQTGDKSQLFYLFNLESRIPAGLSCFGSIRSRPRRQQGRYNPWAAWVVGHVRRQPTQARRSGEPRRYATAATNAGVDEDTVGKLLNHGGRSVTSRYIKTSYLGRMLAAAQEDISAHLVKALGSPRGLA